MGDVPKCPVHGIPDCSPLLNGCSRLTAPPPVKWTFDGEMPPEVEWREIGPSTFLYRFRDGDGLVSAWSDQPVMVVQTPAGGRAPVDGVAPDGSEPTSPPAGPCVTCGHAKRHHIYEEGACRPGFVCEQGCTAYVAVSPVAGLTADGYAWLSEHIPQPPGPPTGMTVETLASVMEAAPDPCGWRAGMSHDDYVELAGAVLRSGDLDPNSRREAEHWKWVAAQRGEDLSRALERNTVMFEKAMEVDRLAKAALVRAERYRLAWLSARIGRATGANVDGRRADRLLKDLPPRVRRLTFRRWRRS